MASKKALAVACMHVFYVACSRFPSEAEVESSFADNKKDFVALLSMLTSDPGIHNINATVVRTSSGIFEMPASGVLNAGDVNLSRERWRAFQALIQTLRLEGGAGVGEDGTIYFRRYQSEDEEMGLVYSAKARPSCTKELAKCSAAQDDTYSSGPRTYQRVFRQVRPHWYIYQVRSRYDRSKD